MAAFSPLILPTSSRTACP